MSWSMSSLKLPHWMRPWSGSDEIEFVNLKPDFQAVYYVTIPGENLMEHG